MSNTHKEGVHNTCAGVDGYRMELGCHGGSQHSTCESEYNIERVGHGLRGAAALDRQVDGLIKGNPRSAPAKTNAAPRCADAASAWTPRRVGKRQCL